MNEFGIALLWCAVQVTALSLAAGLCYLVARRFSPSAGSLVTLTSLMVVIALSVLALSPWPQWTPLLTATARQFQLPQKRHKPMTLRKTVSSERLHPQTEVERM